MLTPTARSNMYSLSYPACRQANEGLRMRQDLQKARALGNALLFFLVVPWTLTLIFYTGAKRH